jgi:hypothetical protein
MEKKAWERMGLDDVWKTELPFVLDMVKEQHTQALSHHVPLKVELIIGHTQSC